MTNYYTDVKVVLNASTITTLIDYHWDEVTDSGSGMKPILTMNSTIPVGWRFPHRWIEGAFIIKGSDGTLPTAGSVTLTAYGITSDSATTITETFGVAYLSKGGAVTTIDNETVYTWKFYANTVGFS